MEKAPKKLPAPLQWAGGYTLDLYCDRDHGADPNWFGVRNWGEFTGQTLSDCTRQAKAKGWVLRKDRTATCPACAKAMKQSKGKARDSD